MKYGGIIGGVIGLIIGAVAGFLQSDNEDNETRTVSAKSDAILVDNPTVQSIEVVSNWLLIFTSVHRHNDEYSKNEPYLLVS